METWIQSGLCSGAMSPRNSGKSLQAAQAPSPSQVPPHSSTPVIPLYRRVCSAVGPNSEITLRAVLPLKENIRGGISLEGSGFSLKVDLGFVCLPCSLLAPSAVSTSLDHCGEQCFLPSKACLWRYPNCLCPHKEDWKETGMSEDQCPSLPLPLSLRQ